MAKTLNADEFAQCVFTWQGKDYRFFPASIKDLIEYYDGDLFPRIVAAGDDQNKILELRKEAILHQVPEMTADVVDSLPQEVFWKLVRFVQHGENGTEAKN